MATLDLDDAFERLSDTALSILADRRRLLEACDLVIIADGTMHLPSSIDNMRQVVASVRMS